MSRIGKKPVEILEGVELSIKELPQGGYEVKVKGPKGELSRNTSPLIIIEKKENFIIFKPTHKTKQSNALWGTERALIANMIKGVKDGFSKQLEIQGVGFKASLSGKNLNLSLGFSHPVVYEIPQNIEAKVEKNIITISGIDKELVGKVASEIRALKKPEPYKGKGIRYVGEIVRRKAGKKAVGK